MAKKRNKEKPPAPPLGFVTFASDDPPYRFTCRLGGDDIKPKFDSGWVREKRPRKRSIVFWEGNDGAEMEIPLLFDHFISGDGVTCEAEIRQLEKMEGQEEGFGEPPVIAFNSGGLVPHDEHDASQIDWVVANVDWGKADRNSSGNRIRQAATVTLWEFVEDEQLDDDSSAAKNKKRNNPKNKRGNKKQGSEHKTHHVQPDETLSTIARDELGDAARWREIAAKNPKGGRPRRDPKAVTPGETLKMP